LREIENWADEITESATAAVNSVWNRNRLQRLRQLQPQQPVAEFGCSDRGMVTSGSFSE
jgi:hypothetical protein